MTFLVHLSFACAQTKAERKGWEAERVMKIVSRREGREGEERIRGARNDGNESARWPERNGRGISGSGMYEKGLKSQEREGEGETTWSREMEIRRGPRVDGGVKGMA